MSDQWWTEEQEDSARRVIEGNEFLPLTPDEMTELARAVLAAAGPPSVSPEPRPKITEWVEMDPFAPDPDPLPQCPVGHNGHRWMLSIEEGQAVLSLAEGEVCPLAPGLAPTDKPVPVCEMTTGDYHELITMEPIEVGFKWLVTIYYDGDHDAWIELTPAVSPPEEPAEGYAVMRSSHYGIPTLHNALARAAELDEKEAHFAPHRVCGLVPVSQEPPK